MKSNGTYMRQSAIRCFLSYAFLLLYGLTSLPGLSHAQSSSLVWLDGGALSYAPFAMEGQSNAVNIIPDFSHAGYFGGGVALPEAPVVITLSPSGGDDTGPIQAAIDAVEAMAPDGNGLRGAVLLQAGYYEVGQLFIEQSGVVLRGEGQGPDGTVLHANLQVKHDFITIRGTGSGFDRMSSTRQDITTPYVPLGAYSFDIADASAYAVGDTIALRRTPNAFWIEDIGMEAIGWTTSSYAIFHERVITGISGNTITLNIPIVDVIEDQYGGGELYKASVPGRIQQCGVENLRIRSYYAPGNPTDEEHAWIGVKLERVTDSWVKNVTGQFLGYGTVSITSESNFNTIQDCAYINPKSQISGGRRYAFNISDGLGNFFQRNYAMQGRHDFVTGSRVTGPNVFLDNYSTETYSDIGPHHRWATGLLFDNVRGGAIRVQNRGTSGSGHGWAGNTTMFWNVLSYTSEVKVESPPGGKNWGIGCRGLQQSGAGHWEHWNNPVLPRSLYLQQLEDRLGIAAVENITIPEQRNGDLYPMLENWAGGGGFEQASDDEILYITEDAYVRGDEHSDTNFGTEDYLSIKNNGEGHRNDRRTFLKFDLSSLTAPVLDVKLRLNVANDAPGPTLDALHYVPDDSWSEETITYSTQPAVGAFIDTVPVPPHGAWIEYDITNLVNTEIASDGILSLRLTSFFEGATLHAYSAKEESGQADEPHLAYKLNDCSPGLLLLNDHPIGPETYQSDSTIESRGTVTTMSEVHFRAATSITLKPGFRAAAGATFSALIEDCAPLSYHSTDDSLTDADEFWIQEQESKIPVGTDQLAFFPNPFNQQATIVLHLSEAKPVDIRLYDLNGRLNKHLLELAPLDSGKNYFYLGRSGLAPGVYILAVRAGKKIHQKRVVVF